MINTVIFSGKDKKKKKTEKCRVGQDAASFPANRSDGGMTNEIIQEGLVATVVDNGPLTGFVQSKIH